MGCTGCRDLNHRRLLRAQSVGLDAERGDRDRSGLAGQVHRALARNLLKRTRARRSHPAIRAEAGVSDETVWGENDGGLAVIPDSEQLRLRRLRHLRGRAASAPPPSTLTAREFDEPWLIALTTRTQVRVVPSEKSWRIEVPGEIARTNKTGLLIHGRDKKSGELDTHGNYPRRPKG